MDKNFLKNRVFVSAVLSFAAALCCFLPGKAGLFRFSDYRAYDTLFYLRALFDKPDPPDVPVVIIEIDDQTVKDKDFQIPMTLWNNYFGEVIQALADSGAKVIGLDYLLPQALFDEFVDKYSHPWLQSIVYAKSKETHVISGCFITSDRRILPHSKYLEVIGRENIGFFNPITDADHVIRRHRLVWRPGDAESSLYNFSFSYLLFKACNPEYRPPSETIWIDYARPDRFVKRYPFIEVFRKICENDLYFLRQHFQDKTVLIGSTDTLSPDRHLTPLCSLYPDPSRRTYGVEIHANVLLTLYNGRFFSEIPVTAGFGICFVLSLAVSLSALYRGFRWAISCLAVSILLFCIISFFSFTQYHLLPYTAASLSACLGLMLVFAYRYIYLDKESRRIQSLFDSFQESRVVKELLKSDDETILKGINIHLCVLFSDIRDFTPFCLERSNEEVVRRLNEYYPPMMDAISHEKGIVNRTFGDGILAFFGAYENPDNPSLAAVNAGIRMMTVLNSLNMQWKIKGEKPFKIGIGLHTGKVQLGALGSTRRREFTLTGDTANLAARVQSATKELGETFLITDAVYQEVVGRLPKGIAFTDRGEMKVKGREKEPVHMWAIRI